jgi:hypothetical protein
MQKLKRDSMPLAHLTIILRQRKIVSATQRNGEQNLIKMTGKKSRIFAQKLVSGTMKTKIKLT